MRFFAQIFGVISIGFAAGCVSSSVRLPASFKPNYAYNSKITTPLKSAAANGILFQVSDSVFRDVPLRQVDQCRKAEAPTWSAQLTGLFEILSKHAEYYNKFHIIDIKRGDKARVEVSNDLHHVSYLTISYAKRETREKITPSTSMPCQEPNSEYQGKDVIITNIDWPTSEEIRSVLANAPAKEEVEDFKFNTGFLEYLADRQTVLKINPEVSFERTSNAELFLKVWLDKMAQEVKESENTNYVDYWLKEISSRSKQAQQIQFFGLHHEGEMNYGVQVDTVGKFQRKLNGYQEPTYLFSSYAENSGDTVSAGLKEINQCLRDLYGIYGNPLAMSSSLESEGESFLAPGYSCKTEVEKTEVEKK